MEVEGKGLREIASISQQDKHLTYLKF
ncbi:uncharacterized protein G2W53_001903 [Senna tora]|uniref:Uncharacterized protein n=1 Tax=Senna tora TaxID=362788 RepID=A0A834XI34_9FABA|nr:uncharacterized protein G2W53_001903 [Senna tora]